MPKGVVDETPPYRDDYQLAMVGNDYFADKLRLVALHHPPTGRASKNRIRGLRDSKAKAAALVIDTLEEAGLPAELDQDGLQVEVELDRAAAVTWMRSFTDVRLALATRLGIEDGDEDFWMSLPDDDPRSHVHDIYEWVGYLQETLVQSLSR